jgi:hypothetical protein
MSEPVERDDRDAVLYELEYGRIIGDLVPHTSKRRSRAGGPFKTFLAAVVVIAFSLLLGRGASRHS